MRLGGEPLKLSVVPLTVCAHLLGDLSMLTGLVRYRPDNRVSYRCSENGKL